MNEQDTRRIYLIENLLSENEEYQDIVIPENVEAQKRLLRSLFNIRLPKAVGSDFLEVQDAYLKEEIRKKGITDLKDLKPLAPDLYLWQGDITTLSVDAIVNAANSGMTGCYVPCHNCIDNCIHSFSGIQLRNECDEYMKRRKRAEETGKAHLTNAYNLPSKYVIHTVGPIITGPLKEQDKKLLESCYRSCLELADENGLNSIAFCCISTGEFHFPNEEAAEIALKTVKEYKAETGSNIKVIFNVFKDLDYEVYRRLLSEA